MMVPIVHPVFVIRTQTCVMLYLGKAFGKAAVPLQTLLAITVALVLEIYPRAKAERANRRAGGTAKTIVGNLLPEIGRFFFISDSF